MSTDSTEAKAACGESSLTGGLGKVVGCIGHDGDCCKNREQELREAARYRFLREAMADAAKMEALNRANKDPQTPSEFDAAVDLAMSRFPNEAANCCTNARPAGAARRRTSEFTGRASGPVE